MKKISITFVVITFAIFLSFGSNFALAADTTYVDSVVSFSQGMQKDGNPIEAARSDPTKALGVEDGTFVSLGYSGEIILSFPVYVGGSLVVTVYEKTLGQYPEEKAEVFVSQDGLAWTSVGTADNLPNPEPGDVHDTIFDLEGGCIKYVKLVDMTDSSLHGDTSDGFDLDAVKADYTEECPPQQPTQEECNTKIINNNEAVVINRVETTANTGGNMAGGSYAGSGGDGGAIVNEGEGDIENSNTGNGGTGGNSGVGGTIITGNAEAMSGVINYVNVNRTLVDRCACQGQALCECSNDLVRNSNRAFLLNAASTEASTGVNYADGSVAGAGGSGGAIVNNNSKEGDVQESNTGTGGNGGSSVDGGLVTTGTAISTTSVINVVNRNLTRILR